MIRQGNTVQPTIPFERDSDSGAAFASSGVAMLLAPLLVIAAMPKPALAVTIGALAAVSARATRPVIRLWGTQIRTGGARGDMSATVKILLGLTDVVLAPGILVPTTAFVSIVIFLPLLLVDPVVSSAPLGTFS
jgi:flagellar biosynthesis protein FliP